MAKKETTAEQLARQAAEKALKDVLAGFELKIQKAFELGAEIGAAKGAEIGARAALEAVEEERQKFKEKRLNRQLRNTRLLLQHYRSLNSHYACAVWEEGENDADQFVDIMELMSARGYADEVFVDSIKKSSEKTCIIMRHVNTMLDEYRTQCEESRRPEDMRHWRVIEALYLGEVRIPAQEIAERESIDKRTVYKDVDAAVDDLTMLFFGVEGIEKL